MSNDPTRYHLPETASSLTTRFNHVGDLDVYIIVVFYDSIIVKLNDQSRTITQPGQVVLKLGKEGSTLAGMAQVVSNLISMLLQYNIPWDRVSNLLSNIHFEPQDEKGRSLIHNIVSTIDGLLEGISLTDQGCKL